MPKKILIVDDDRVMVKMVENFLQLQGFDVVSASDGEEGLEKLKIERPHMVILDVQMPKMDGYNFILEARNVVDLKNLPILVLTAKDGMDDIFKVEGVREYLVKPFEPESLLAKMKKYL